MWCRYRNDAMSLMHSLIKEPGLDADVVVQVGAGATMVTIRTGLNYGSSAEGQIDTKVQGGGFILTLPLWLSCRSLLVSRCVVPRCPPSPNPSTWSASMPRSASTPSTCHLIATHSSACQALPPINGEGVP